MFAPKSQNGPRTQQTPSSRGGRNISKSRCEGSSPLNGWAQDDQAEQDVYYLAIDSWAKRNAKIKPDAPKGVPSSKVWEPFLCTTVDKCSSIPDFETFTHVSLRLHQQIKADESRPDQTEQRKVPAEKNVRITKGEEGMDVGKNGPPSAKSAEEVGNKDESKQEKSDKLGNSAPLQSETGAEYVQGSKSSQNSDTDMVTDGPTPMEGKGDEDSDYDVDSIKERTLRQNSSQSAPISRIQQIETCQRRGASAKPRTSKSVSFSADDKLRRAAMRKSNKSDTPQKVLVQPNPVKISYAHASNPCAGIFAGNLPLNGLVNRAESNQYDDELEVATDDNRTKGRTSVERRMLIEEALRDSKKVEYMPRTAHVSIGDLLYSTPRLERRLGLSGHSRDFISAIMMKGADDSSSMDTFSGWPTTQQNNNGDGIASPTNDSSLPPVPVCVTNSNLIRDVHTSPSASQADPRKSTNVRSAVHLKSAKIPVISYKRGQRRELQDGEDEGDTDKEMTSDPEDTRYMKYTDSIMSAIRETTIELDSDLTNVLAHPPTTQPASKSGGNKNGDKVKRRGPPAFRPLNFKTPLQRAVENAHKKIYGQHYYLFCNNLGHQGNEGPEESRVSEGINGQAINQRTQSAKSDVTSAYVWKENTESQIRYKRNANPTTARTGDMPDITPKTNKHRSNRSSVVDHDVKNSKVSGLKKNRDKNGNGKNVCTMSDFRPNFGKSGALKTDRGNVIQR